MVFFGQAGFLSVFKNALLESAGLEALQALGVPGQLWLSATSASQGRAHPEERQVKSLYRWVDLGVSEN